MKKPLDGQVLASEILSRSSCSVQVGAAISDRWGIFSWGWNSVGDGYGQCAERHAVHRANKKRLYGATIYVAGIRNRNQRFVPAKPCVLCRKVIQKWQLHVMWRDNDGEWRMQG
jgi:cytidine deaminase